MIRHAIALALGVGAFVAAPAAQAATCTSADGVSVIVDFGGSVQSGCASGDPATAWAALEAAGFRLEGTQRFPGSFVCRVNGFPAPADEACVQTPPASAYWAIWTASAGGSWSYSNSGAASLNPAPGQAIGLAFGAGRKPGVAPPSPPTTTSSSSSSSSSTSSAPNSSSTTRPPASTSTSTAAPTPPALTHSPTSRTTTSTSTTRTTTGNPPTETTTSNAPAPGASDGTSNPEQASNGIPASTGSTPAAAILAGGGAIGLLFVGGALLARRQRDRARQ